MKAAARAQTGAGTPARFVLSTCILFPAFLVATGVQASGPTIAGVIMNRAGVRLAGAKVTLTNEAASSIRSTVTSEDGRFIFNSVEPGTYDLTAALDGYEPATHRHLVVRFDQPVSVDLTLTPVPSRDAQSGGTPPRGGSISSPPSYDDTTPLRPSNVKGAVDAAGYSSPGQARTSNRLLQGVAGMKKTADITGGGAKALGGLSPTALAAREAELQSELSTAPQSYAANHHLGDFYLQTGNPARGIPYLETAEELDPSHYDNGYDLAAAYAAVHDAAKARAQIRRLIVRQDTAALHHLLAEVEEVAGNFGVAAVEYERTARMDPSEENIFDWGSELLVHRAFDSAIEAFSGGVERYPRSATLQIGFGVALYSRGRYEEAIKALCTAADLTPADPRPYIFLGKMYNVKAANADDVAARLKRFATLQPENPQAHYYLALSLWKGQKSNNEVAPVEEVESQLRRSMELDSKFADAHLELGHLYADEKKLPEAIREYQQAIALQPDLADAYYHLAQAYNRAGEKERAREELVIHDRLRKQQLAEEERQRAETQKFLSSMKESSQP